MVSQCPWRRRFAAATLVLGLLPPVSAQGPTAGNVEDLVVARLVRTSRFTPTDFCAAVRTAFAQPATIEDRYELKAVATDVATGRVIDASGAAVGTLHACYGPTADVRIYSFFGDGEIKGVAMIGRGQCRVTRRDFPEAGISTFSCQLDLMPLTSAYIGGQLTTNGLGSRAVLGPDTSPAGYTQTSIATIRLWKRRWPLSLRATARMRVRRRFREARLPYRIAPLRTAYNTISAALWTSSFSMMRARCVSTVLEPMNSSLAISLFVFPSATSWKISRSRSDSDS